MLEIEGIESVDEEIEIRSFVVRTRQGVRTFQTLRDEWPRELPGGALLIRDVVGDLYLIRDADGMDFLRRGRNADMAGHRAALLG